MRELFQLPELISKPVMSKRDAGKPDVSVFKGRQLSVFTGIMGRLEGDGGCLMVLEGFAGVGKTFTVSRIIEQYLYLHPLHKVAFASTTNRSLEVSFKSTEFTHPMLTFATIHKLLALKETILPDGSLDFYPDKWITPSITEYKVVFIDESSQFSKKLWGFLSNHTDCGIKIILIGDKNQTPPVKESDSLVFTSQWQQANSARLFQLTDIIRQAADNPIITVATHVRENLSKRMNINSVYGYKDMLWQRDLGAYFLDEAADGPFLDKLLHHMFKSGNFSQDTNFAKCVAWRRKTVAALNKGIRKIIYGKGKLRRIEPLEKIISSAPIWDLNYDNIEISNGKQMEVVDFERCQETINDGQYVLHYYATKVRYYDMFGTQLHRIINIPTDLGVIVFNEVLKQLADAANSYKQGTFQFKSAWADFYRFQKSFAAIQHDYASTLHTIQGSSIENVVVFNFDVMRNHKIVETNKLLYTAITRASQRVFII